MVLNNFTAGVGIEVPDYYLGAVVVHAIYEVGQKFRASKKRSMGRPVNKTHKNERFATGRIFAEEVFWESRFCGPLAT